jgi:hypothetical protein
MPSIELNILWTMEVRGCGPIASKSMLPLRCYPADLNELGRRIKVWLVEPSEPLIVDWRDD